MTQIEINNGKELIAKFYFGVLTLEGNDELRAIEGESRAAAVHAFCASPDLLKYNESWDMLLPVWNKLKHAIDSEGLMTRNFPFYGEWYSQTCGHILNAEMQAAFTCIVRGIDYYNNVSFSLTR